MAKRLQTQGPNVRDTKVQVVAPIVDTYYKPDQKGNEYTQLSNFLNEVVPEINRLSVDKDNERIEREVEMLGEIAISNLDGKTYQEVVNELGLRDSHASHVAFNSRLGTEAGKNAAQQVQSWWAENQRRFYEAEDKTLFETEREALQQELFPKGQNGLGYASAYNKTVQGTFATVDQNFYASFTKENQEHKAKGLTDTFSIYIDHFDDEGMNKHKEFVVQEKMWTGEQVKDITNGSFSQNFALVETVEGADKILDTYKKMKSGSGMMFDVFANKVFILDEYNKALTRLAQEESRNNAMQNMMETEVGDEIADFANKLIMEGKEVTEEAIIAEIGEENFNALGEDVRTRAMLQGINSGNSFLVSQETNRNKYESIKEQFDELSTKEDRDALLGTLLLDQNTSQGRTLVKQIYTQANLPESNQIMVKSKLRINAKYGVSENVNPTTTDQLIAKARAAELLQRVKDYYVADLITNPEIPVAEHEALINKKIEELLLLTEFNPTSSEKQFFDPDGTQLSNQPPPSVSQRTVNNTPQGTGTGFNINQQGLITLNSGRAPNITVTGP